MKEEIKYFEGENNLDDAFAYIKSYMKDYHPAGYGTDAHISLDVKGLKVKMTRLDTCD